MREATRARAVLDAGAAHLARDDFFWAIGAACRVHGVPFDAALLAQQSPPPHSVASLHHALQSLGLKAGLIAAAPTALPVPCLALIAGEAGHVAIALVVEALADAVRLLYPGEVEPRTLPVG